MGGIYNLRKMAINKPIEAKNISEILCAHARSTTQKKDYQKEYSNKPSNEIQLLLDLLNKKEGNPFKEIRLDLSSTYLRGAKLREAQLQEANLSKTQLQEANLSKAQLQEANLSKAQLQEANLSKAQLQGANLIEAQLREAKLIEAQLQEAKLIKAQLQGAYLSKAQLQEAKLIEAQLHGADLRVAQLQGADLEYAQLQGAKLIGTQLQGANLEYAQLQGANLFGVKLQGADLSNAQLQGANLRYAQLQGANLHNVQLQGADLSKAQLQGTFTEKIDIAIYSISSFKERITNRIDKTTELKTAIFKGGIDEEYIKDLKKYLSPMVEKKFLTQERPDILLNKLESHIRPVEESDYDLPENSGATTGILTKEMAKEIIKKYDEAMNYKKSS